jgi:hypothetical protein
MSNEPLLTVENVHLRYPGGSLKRQMVAISNTGQRMPAPLATLYAEIAQTP